uniref:Uncharacterized protein n=1 Tax=Anopheles minimus TaxID=112268 RepID=A0A182VS80_9DIPT
MKYVYVALLLMALVCALAAHPAGSIEDSRSVPSGNDIILRIAKRNIPLGWLQALQSQNFGGDSDSSEE